MRPPGKPVTIDEFSRVDVRAGTVLRCEDFPEARIPALKLWIDFGPEIGEKRSSARLSHYRPPDLVGRQVLGVVNLPPRQIGPFVSEVLTLGVYEGDSVVLVRPDRDVANGSRLG